MIFPAYRALGAALEVLPGPWTAAQRIRSPQPLHGVIHGASAGEVQAARALHSALLQHDPASAWLVSSGSPIGMACGADFRMPRDLPGQTARMFEMLGLQSLILIEAELWPNLLFEAGRRGVPVGVAGARISKASYRRMQRMRKQVSSLFRRVRAFAAASTRDAERLQSLGVPAGRIEVCGWLKWPEESPVLDRDALLRGLGQSLPDTAPLLVLGSVYPGEPSALAKSLRDSPLAPSRAHWLLVPRHSRHVRTLRAEAASLCLPDRFSIETSFGVLRSWYAQGDAAFVGGGLRGRGCHNLLEPLALGLRPMCFSGAGDPAGVAEFLAHRDLAIVLDRPGSQDLGDIASQALDAAHGCYQQLQQDQDGRNRSLSFLQRQGVVS